MAVVETAARDISAFGTPVHVALDSATLDWLPDALVAADASGRIVSANAPACRLLGYSRQALLQQTLEKLFLDSDGLSRLDRHVFFHPLHSASHCLELQAQRQDGACFPAEIALSYLHANGALYVLGAIRDISRRNEIEQELRRSEALYRRLAEEVRDYAIFMLDAEGRVLTWNEGARLMRGYRSEEILGSTIAIFFTPEDRLSGRLEEELKEAAQKGRIEFEGWRVRKDGSRFWAQIVMTALHDAGGKLLGFTKVARDVTNRKQVLETVLLEISQRLIAHLDFEQLLSAIAASLRQIKPHDYAGLALYEPASRKLKICSLSSDSSGKLQPQEQRVSLQNSPAGWAFKARKPLVLCRVRENQWPLEIPRILLNQGVRSLCRIPLIYRDRILGTLNLASRGEDSFSPEDVELLLEAADPIAAALNNALSYGHLAELKDKMAGEKRYLESELRNRFNTGKIVGKSAALAEVLRQVQTVAATDSTVLLLGETGTGKELIARAIHEASARREKSFITVNCAALPASLLESELFGHEKGAFTGSATRQIGRLELAHHGTLFFDEVGDIPLELQPKLLRALQLQQFERLGSGKTITVDVRLIAATNRDLESLVAEGRFRSDLYYRLCVFPITLPPLRQRREDIPLLAKYFLETYSRRMGKEITGISADALQQLCNYPWPGNIRELEHFIERAAILTAGTRLQIPPLGNAHIQREPASPDETLAAAERQHILRTLREVNGIVGGARGAAVRLGLKRTTLAAKMRRLGIARGDF